MATNSSSETSRDAGDGASIVVRAPAVATFRGRTKRSATSTLFPRLVVGADMTDATLHTNRGDIEVELHDERAPRTVENFVGLAKGKQAWEDDGETVEKPLYDDVAFHRVIEGFMIQGGDPDETGRGGPGYEFDDEFHDELRHDSAGTLSMANSGPDTNGSQFFITLDSQPHLDDRHAVFGQVTDGMDVVREIGSVPTEANDRPQEEVVLESVEIHD